MIVKKKTPNEQKMNQLIKMLLKKQIIKIKYDKKKKKIKKFFQLQVPLQLPCYDFAPVTDTKFVSAPQSINRIELTRPKKPSL